MEDELKNIDRFEAYLNGELSKEERELFNEETSKDPDFKEEFETYKNAITAIRILNRNVLRKDIEKIASEIDEVGERDKPFKIGSYLKYAAILIGVALIPLYFVFRNNATKTDVFADNFSPYQMISTERGEEQDSILNLAVVAYNKQNFDEASSFFKNVYEKNETEETQFYLSISLLGNKQYEEAIIQLKKLCENKLGLYYEQSLWYLSLAYIATEDFAKAETLLKQIVENNSYSYEKAQKILKEL